MQLGIMMGFPRSGKTTYAMRYLSGRQIEDRFTRVSPDDIRLAIHGRAWVAEAEPMVWAMTEIFVRSLLRGDSDVLVDATNLTSSSRRAWFKLAKEFSLPLDIYWMPTNIDVCRERNAGEGAVPADLFEHMRQTFTMPHEVEGWFRLYNLLADEWIAEEYGQETP